MATPYLTLGGHGTVLFDLNSTDLHAIRMIIAYDKVSPNQVLGGMLLYHTKMIISRARCVCVHCLWCCFIERILQIMFRICTVDLSACTYVVIYVLMLWTTMNSHCME